VKREAGPGARGQGSSALAAFAGPVTVLAIGFDLFFKPRITQAAETVDTRVTFAKPEEAPGKAVHAERVIMDASAPGALDALAAIRNARPDVPVLACYPHVEADKAAAAEALGARTVTRGAFNNSLPDAVAGRL
jgi:CheY-like chemotaxis protein